jgi:apolipoprotein N-acyltransferase
MIQPSTWPRWLVALVGGALVGLSLPPIGWWPMAVAGVAAIAWSLADRSLRGRFAIGWLAGLGQFSISLFWAIQFNIGGYVVLAIMEALFIALACAIVPPWRGRLPALAGALVLAEAARQSWPFGGLPLGGLALGQASGPIGLDARLGGPLLIVGVTVLAGAAVAALVPQALVRSTSRHSAVRGARSAGSRIGRGTAESTGPSAVDKPLAVSPTARRAAAAVALVTAAGITAVAAFVAPNGTTAGGAGAKTLRIAIVQGGGRRGLDQLQVPPSVVFAAAVKATAKVPPDSQLILWPEDVVALNNPFVGSSAESELAAIARAHHATLIAGVTYPVGTTLFRNEIVALSPAGSLVATFEKVHRVPFGEYVPWRSFFRHLASLKDIPRDAIAGRGSGMIDTPTGRAAVLVSYEVFFASRGRSGVRAGGQVILVPTNTSSYANNQAPAQEIAASRLQAIEEGRYVLQAAPTGYSGVVNNDGDVLRRTPLSSPAIVTATVPLLDGRTWYEQGGDIPVLIAALALVAAGWLFALSSEGMRPRRRRTSPSS